MSDEPTASRSASTNSGERQGDTTLRVMLDRGLTEAGGEPYWYNKLDAIETAVGEWLVSDGFIDALYDALGDDTGLTFPVRREQVAEALGKAGRAAASGETT